MNSNQPPVYDQTITGDSVHHIHNSFSTRSYFSWPNNFTHKLTTSLYWIPLLVVTELVVRGTQCTVISYSKYILFQDAGERHPRCCMLNPLLSDRLYLSLCHFETPYAVIKYCNFCKPNQFCVLQITRTAASMAINDVWFYKTEGCWHNDAFSGMFPGPFLIKV